MIRKKPKTTKYVFKFKVALTKYWINAKNEYRKRDSYYQDMEDRIKRMESAIIASGLQGQAGLVDVKEEEEEEEEDQEEKTSSDMIESQAKLSNQFANLVINSNGSSNFIGMYRSKLSACSY